MSTPRPLVLVAEDEPLASLALRAQLEALDYRVLGPARNGRDALALGSCFPVDIALFDYRMPGLTGLEAGQALFRLAPTPVVLLTGFDIVNLPERVTRPPIFAALTKPVELRDLRSGLEQAATGFAAWADAEPSRHDRLRTARQERTLIARAVAVLTQDDDTTPTPAATRLVAKAADEDRPLLDVARDILDGAR
jgi:two-component system, response regulator PdtaR